MINLMYIVLLAMLALNVSNDVLKGFSLISDSLLRASGTAMKENGGRGGAIRAHWKTRKTLRLPAVSCSPP